MTNFRGRIKIPSFPKLCEQCGQARTYGVECQNCDNPTADPPVGTPGQDLSYSHYKPMLIEESEVKRANKIG